MRLQKLTFIEDKRLFIIVTILGMLGLVPALYPIVFLDGKPVTVLGWKDDAPVKLYIDILERYRVAYIPLYITSIALILVGIMGSLSPNLIALDYVFVLLVAYTAATVPLTKVVSSMRIPYKISDNVGGVLVTTTFSSISYTPIFYLFQYYVVFLASLFLTVAVGVYIVLSKE